jgi:2-amino-4-hydroxy-6-hydroxymethyldihydropteridine diphosphokinase
VQKTVYLSLGSNLDRAANLRTAIDRLASRGVVAAVSSFETEPVEFTAQPWFLNCAVKLSAPKKCPATAQRSSQHRKNNGTTAG